MGPKWIMGHEMDNGTQKWIMGHEIDNGTGNV